MFKSLRVSVLWAAAAVAGFGLSPTFSSAAYAGDKQMLVGTGGVTGVYYPAGGAICRLVNRGRKEHGIRCLVESTGGSINNLDDLRAGEIQLAVVQSDWLYHAYKGTEAFSDQGPNPKLRVLFRLHSEPFTVVARRDSKINSFDDLKGKRVNVGNPGSGMRATMEELMRSKGWTEKSFSQLLEMRPSDQIEALCGNKIDAMIYAVGHPNGAIQQVTTSCATRLINVDGAPVDQLVRDYPFYSYATIPGGMYVGNPQEVKTFGVRAVLVANDDMEDDTAYRITKAVFENLDNFKTLHPVFATLDANKMAATSEGLVPMHPGAMRFFKEKGLLNEAQ